MPKKGQAYICYMQSTYEIISIERSLYKFFTIKGKNKKFTFYTKYRRGGKFMEERKGGAGMAIASLVCSIISLVPSVIILIAGTSIISMLGVM